MKALGEERFRFAGDLPANGAHGGLFQLAHILFDQVEGGFAIIIEEEEILARGCTSADVTSLTRIIDRPGLYASNGPATGPRPTFRALNQNLLLPATLRPPSHFHNPPPQPAPI